MTAKKPRKDRSDITVGRLEKKHGLPPGMIRNPDGRGTRSDKKLGTIRKEESQGNAKLKGSEEWTEADDRMFEAWEKVYRNRKSQTPPPQAVAW